MESQVCPFCNTKVVLNADGTCPACRALVQLQPNPESATPPPVSPIGSNPYAGTAPQPSPSPPKQQEGWNPYQAPKIEATSGRRYQYTGPDHSGPIWLFFSFRGRIPRRYYWGASILATAIFYAIIFATAPMSTYEPSYSSQPYGGYGSYSNEPDISPVGFIVLFIAYPFMIWTSLAISVKRWHDHNKSGWWVLIGFIPCIGPIWQFIELGCLRGTIGDNQYGHDPT